MATGGVGGATVVVLGAPVDATGYTHLGSWVLQDLLPYASRPGYYISGAVVVAEGEVRLTLDERTFRLLGLVGKPTRGGFEVVVRTGGDQWQRLELFAQRWSQPLAVTVSLDQPLPGFTWTKAVPEVETLSNILTPLWIELVAAEYAGDREQTASDLLEYLSYAAMGGPQLQTPVDLYVSAFGEASAIEGSQRRQTITRSIWRGLSTPTINEIIRQASGEDWHAVFLYTPTFHQVAFNGSVSLVWTVERDSA